MCCECCKSISTNCCKNGLGAVKNLDRRKIHFNNPRNINCSIDIDSCLKTQYSNANRWDYLICYQDKFYFVEIHPATSGEKVKQVLKKFEWLKNTILNRDNCRNSEKVIYWIATDKITISKRHNKYKHQLEAKRIKLVRSLNI